MGIGWNGQPLQLETFVETERGRIGEKGRYGRPGKRINQDVGGTINDVGGASSDCYAVGSGLDTSDEIRSTKNIRGTRVADADEGYVGKVGEIGDTDKLKLGRGAPGSRQFPGPAPIFDVGAIQGSNRDRGRIRADKRISGTHINTEIRSAAQVFDLQMENLLRAIFSQGHGADWVVGRSRIGTANLRASNDAS